MTDVNNWVDPNAYIQKRLDEYPAWGAQLDKIYHNGIDAWKADIKKQKEKIDKNEKKLYQEANRYKVKYKITGILLNLSLKTIIKLNKRKIKKY